MGQFFKFNPTAGKSKQVTGKAADSGYTKQKKAESQTANRETLASAFGLSGSGNSTTQNTSSTVGVQLPTLQTGTTNAFGSGTYGASKQVTGKAADAGLQTGTQRTGVSTASRTLTGLAADSGYTEQKKDASQTANRQVVQNWWRSEQAKSAQDNSTSRAYTAKLTGGANIDNSADVLKSLQRTFGGANDSAKTQYDRTLKSKMGYGRNWGNPRSTVGNAIERGVAGSTAAWLNAAGTALKSDRRSGLAVDSGNVEAEATGNEWYNRAGDYLQKEADWAQMLSENAYLRGSRGLNNAQRLLFDGAVVGTQMAGDLALGALTGGSATIPMAIRSFGSGAQQARQAGASENQQIAYGAASALKEALTEKMFDGLAGVYGKGKADDFVDALARSTAKSEGGQALVRSLVNMGGERIEEITSGLIDPALQGIYNGKTLGENYSDLNMADLWHAGDVATLLGGLGGTVNMAQTGYGMTDGTRLSTPYSDVLREKQPSTPYSDVMNATAAEENQIANHPDQIRYQELERKFLDGSIAPHEGDELWRLEKIWGQVDVSSEQAGSAPGTKDHVRVTDKELVKRRSPLEKTASGDIMKGAKSGALNPESDDASSHAERYYNFARKMTTDVQKIAQNTGFSVSDIQSIKDFIFNEEHELDGGVIRRFDPSYEMAESWQRLAEGKRIMPHDITLLQHELMERSLMMQGLSQDEAHIITSEKYNYTMEAKRYHDQIKKHKK